MTNTLQNIAAMRGFSGHIDHDDKQTILDAARASEITLDGHPAIIGGLSLDFAQVSTVPKGGNGPRYTVEWAWQSAAHVILNGGRFKS